MKFPRRAALAAAVVYAVSAFAALSPQHQEWGSGPVQWIMTADEQRQWKQLATDDDAEKFIQLFWARRDPTFKDEFDRRVLDADQRFPDYNSQHEMITRGSMSDRGRVLIVVGYPEKVKQRLHEAGKPRSHELWIWEKDVAKAKFEMPYVQIGFFEDAKGVFHRDTQDTDFASASAVALKKMIVRPDLKDVPDWARPGSLTGAHALVLLTDPNAVSPEALLKGGEIVTFASNGKVGFAFEYCGPAETLNMTSSISGMVGEKRLNIAIPPVTVKAHAGGSKSSCGMVRGAIPLTGLPVAPGTYTFAVKLDDGTQSYNLTQDFRIE
jgi:GWxTD domain-containing protein